MPRWLLKVLKAKKVSQLQQEVDILCNDLAVCIVAVRTIVGSPAMTDASALAAEQEKLIAEINPYLDSLLGMGHWRRSRQIRRLTQLATDLADRADALVAVALPYLDGFVDNLLQQCEAGLQDLLGFRRRKWDVSDIWDALCDAGAKLMRVGSLVDSEQQTDTILSVYVIHLQVEQALDAIQRTRHQETKNREVGKILARMRSEYPGRKRRLAVQFARLNDFQQDCASWQDIEPWLNEAGDLLAELATGFAELQELVGLGKTAAATSLGAKLQASFERTKDLCDRSEKTRTERRKQLGEASATVTNELKRAWRIARDHGNAKNNEGLQAIRAFVAAYRQAVKENGDMLSVEAISEQAQAIVPAVDALQADPTATIVVAVQTEFAELGCFPE